jgi:hypothetical protein
MAEINKYMEIKEIIERLRSHTADYRPAREAADRMETMERALLQLSECNLTEENCAGFEVANAHIRNVARAGLR